jgi:hypothetical protein
LTLPWTLDVATRAHSLAGVHPEAAEAFQALITEAENLGFARPYLSSVFRTCGEQSGTAGSSAGGGCHSWHVFGRAVDVDLGSEATIDDYAALAETWELAGGTWGGRWTEQYPPHGDYMHFQWTPGLPDAVPASWCPSDLAAADCDEHVRARWGQAQPAKAFRSGSRALVIGGMVAAALGGASLGSVVYRRSKVPALLLGGGLLSIAIGAVRR